MKTSIIFFSLFILSFSAIAQTFQVNTFDDNVDQDLSDEVCATASGACSLRAAIQQANDLPGEDVILLPTGTYSLSIAGIDEDMAASGDLDIHDDLQIIGEQSNRATIDAATLDRVFHVHDHAQVLLSNLNLFNADSKDARGGAILLDRVADNISQHIPFRLHNIHISQSTAGSNQGGAVFVEARHRLSFENVTIENNQARDGAAVFIKNSELFLDSVTMMDNTATTNGGAIRSESALLHILNSQLSNNKAKYGGAISAILVNSPVYVFNSQINLNQASHSGGGFHLGGALATDTLINLNDCDFTSNSASVYGGAIYSQSALTLYKSSVHGNSAGFAAGGLYLTRDSHIEYSTLSENIAQNTIITQDLNAYGGAIYFNGAANLLLSNSTLSGNRVIANTNGQAYGGALFTTSTYVDLSHVSMVGNNATQIDSASQATMSSRIKSQFSLFEHFDTGNNCGALINSQNYNLASDSSCGFDAANDQQAIALMLASLSQNSGDTASHALLAGSPAIDAIDSVDCASMDQRFYQRMSGQCDVGAFELNAQAITLSEIAMANSELSFNENETVAIVVKRQGGSQGEVSIDYRSVDGSAQSTTVDNDYTAIQGRLTWADGDATDQSVFLTLNDDANYEASETFKLQLYNPLGNAVLAADAASIVSIIDNDVSAGTLGFIKRNESFSENIGSISIEVIRYDGFDGEVSVAYDVVDGSAVADVDYVFTPGILTFAQDEIRKSFTIDLINNQQNDGDRNLVLQLTNAQGGAIISDVFKNKTIIINDDELAISTLDFASATYTAIENNGGFIVRLVRQGAIEQAVSVDVTLAGGTATIDEDFLWQNQTVSFAAQQSEATIQIEIVNDEIQEAAETIQLMLSNPQNGAELGETTQTLLTINDDDEKTVSERAIPTNKKLSLSSFNAFYFLLLFIGLALRRELGMKE
ncbi:MAG: CSLREA domain-containing protein [Gammaproteobacteria bacterium]|nr:CSLREA domain-containing protein [Gammaproteobacteria bacterium]